MQVSLDEKIPNNVNLSADRKLRVAHALRVEASPCR